MMFILREGGGVVADVDADVDADVEVVFQIISGFRFFAARPPGWAARLLDILAEGYSIVG